MENVKRYFDERASIWNTLEHMNEKQAKEFLKGYLPLEKGMKVLDVACGTGVISSPLYSITGEKVTAIDLSSEMIKIAKSTHNEDEIDFINCDFMSFEHEKFDFIVCFNAYPHFADPVCFAKRAASLVKRGGYLAILHDASKEELNAHHNAKAAGVSRELSDVETEIKPFEFAFECVRTIDNDSMFLLLFKKI